MFSSALKPCVCYRSPPRNPLDRREFPHLRCFFANNHLFTNSTYIAMTNTNTPRQRNPNVVSETFDWKCDQLLLGQPLLVKL